MSESIEDQIGAIVSTFVARKFWVCFSEPSAPRDQVMPHIPEHLRYLVALEAQGKIFAAGPFLGADGMPSPRAMYILRADSEEEAREMMAEEPLHKRELKVFTVHLWQLNEGRITLHMDFSSQAAGLDGVTSIA